MTPATITDSAARSRRGRRRPARPGAGRRGNSDPLRERRTDSFRLSARPASVLETTAGGW